MSLGAELKDFVGSFQAGYDMVKSKSEKDAASADLDYKRAATSNLETQGKLGALQLSSYPADHAADLAQKQAATANTASEGKLKALQIGSYPADHAADIAYKASLGAEAKTRAESSAYDLSNKKQEDSVFSGAGAISGVSGGGASNDVGGGASTDTLNDTMKAGVHAGVDAMKFMKANLGIDKPTAVEDPSKDAHHTAYLSGEGAAPAPVYQQVMDIVDPGKTMTDGQRAAAAMGLVKQHFDDRKMPMSGQRAAGQILQYTRKASNYWHAMAQAAGEKGDFDGAAKAAANAYNSIPSDQKLVIKKGEGGFNVQVVGVDGKLSADMTMSPQDLLGMVKQYGPESFDDVVVQAAGRKGSPEFTKAMGALDQPGEDGKIALASGDMIAKMKPDEAKTYQSTYNAKVKEGAGPAPATIGERGTAATAVDGAFASLQTSVGDLTGPNAAQEQTAFKVNAQQIQAAATEIYTDNAKAAKPGFTPDVAALIAYKMTVADPEHPEKPPFTFKKGANGTVQVKLGDIQPVVVSGDTFNELFKAFQNDASAKAAAIHEKVRRTERDNATRRARNVGALKGVSMTKALSSTKGAIDPRTNWGMGGLGDMP